MSFRRSLFPFAFLLLGMSFLLNLSMGSVWIPPAEIVEGLLSGNWVKNSWEQIILNYRLPKALVAILAGVGLSISGLQMQTFFRNPLAGPYVLGISSGAGLGVALLMLAGAAFGISLTGLNSWAIAGAGILGAGSLLAIVTLVAWRVKDSMTLLIVGLMVGSVVAAVVAVLSFFSGAEALKLYTVWSMGSLGALTWSQVSILGLLILIGSLPIVGSVKSYNALLMGETYARSMGIPTTSLRWWMIGSTGILAGGITAFCGPIAFLGIAVPHLARMAWKSADHRVLFPGSAILGASLLLLCDAFSHFPGWASSLPINAVTSLIGAPLVISLILKKTFSKDF
uniref:iron chelate uptake ABC transporter family permease subunit n=1 Tax=Algoriphagus sp. TaxID=1872435 RepID=UPI0040483DCC